jgi:hypothetical protein
MNHRETAYGLVPVTMGVIFLFYGLGKFMGGPANFVEVCRKTMPTSFIGMLL